MIVIDGSFLYIALHAKKPGTGETEYPFVGLAIEDPDAQILKDIVTLHKRTFEDARLMRSVD
jgi:hypothetical protein